MKRYTPTMWLFLRKIFLLFLIFSALSVFVVFVSIAWEAFSVDTSPRWGATISSKYAEELGVDWKQVFNESIDDLGIRLYRVPVYWDRVEKTQGEFDWTEYDWIVKQSEQKNIELVFALGYRVPRWPECHSPGWVDALSEEEKQRAILNLLKSSVDHFKSSPAIIRWQVENEPFLAVFGECPPLDEIFYRQEIEFVKSLDSRPIQVTESGELSAWLNGAAVADILGVSMYRTVYNPFIGYTQYPLSGKFYRRKAQYIRNLVDDVIISELQAEPWGPDVYQENGDDRILTPAVFGEAIEVAQRTGFSEIHFWGVEWWWMVKEKYEDPRYWEIVKQTVQSD